MIILKVMLNFVLFLFISLLLLFFVALLLFGLIIYISSDAEHHCADCLIQKDWSDLPKKVVVSKQQLCHTSKTSGGF